ncbi:extracellular solute-binding protein [Mesorhizobium koreense]|jgi:multiple sugar transport system substrate-binding protein|uniref:extracellular solute-binding protein n=1 Tax=Mesorhizobium koreense TaxID=3074855 RepID=UPI00287B700D|nr:extracellular solute-binding protein [Mesorhizobium sp. WR6]
MTNTLDRREFLLGTGMLALGSGLLGTGPARAGAPDFSGRTVRMITQRSVHQNALSDALRITAEKWGAKLEVRQVTASELEKKVVLDHVANSATWDIMYTGGVQRMYEWYGGKISADMTPLIKQYGDPKLLGLEDLDPNARKAVTFDDKVLGLPIATSNQAMCYRKDLFEDASEKAAFKSKYGYDLAPPDTMKQFHDICEFFTRKKGDTLAGKTLTENFYGTVMPNKKGVYIFHNYENLVVAFGSDIYDPKTGKSAIRSERGLEAVRFLRSLIPFLPPGHINMANAESTATFVSGGAATTLEYFDRMLGTVSAGDTKVQRDQVGYALPPVAEDNPKGYKHGARSGPAVMVISSLSKDKELAFKLLQSAMGAETQLEMAKKYPGYMPTRETALREFAQSTPEVDYLVRAAADRDTAMLTDASIMPYPGILRSNQISEALGDALQSILGGADIDPELQRAEGKINAALADVYKS